MPDDLALLKEYAETRSEPAFAELVSRYLNLVYSVAFRSTGNAHAAQEISQAVFIILARKAKNLSSHVTLSGWLYQTTRLTARNYLRTEMRRQNREQEAFMQSTLAENDPELWPQIAPLLDDAMERLGRRDRHAIVERFFENKNLRDVGLALGASEVAARMRVNRALEKLRVFFKRRGVNSTTAAIGENISRHSVQAAPVELAKMVTTIALAKGVTASASVAALAKTTLLAMKIKTIVAASMAVVLVAGITAWFGFHSSPDSPPAHPIDAVPIQLGNGSFKQDGNKDGTFVVEIDPDTLRTNNSTPSIHIKGPFISDTSDTVSNAVADNGTYKKTDNSSSMQYIVGDQSVLYGKRIRVTFWLKTREVHGWAGTFVIILGMDGRHMQYDDMSDRPVRGTSGWQQYEIITDLPKEPCIIYLGPDLYGPGELWADDFRIDLAPANEPVSDDTTWRISDESDPTLYAVSADPAMPHGDHPSLCFSYSADDPAPRGIHARLGHDFYGPDSDKYCGHTVRMSGWIKTENVSGRIEPVITPCAGWNNVLAKDSMSRDYSLKGTRDWMPFSVTCAIPNDTTYLRTGFVFSGSGKAWIDLDSIKYEIVK
ncbi:MAG TPA: sigma-70 family RNA polymerase sigma factor [Pseudomonadales bacterium]|nr:sigma-70 family RNA polymerase sigma factor [Pseudomonadales bacterium]